MARKSVVIACNSVCTSADVAQRESAKTSLLSALASGLEDFRQTLVRVAVSTDHTPVQKMMWQEDVAKCPEAEWPEEVTKCSAFPKKEATICFPALRGFLMFTKGGGGL